MTNYSLRFLFNIDILHCPLFLFFSKLCFFLSEKYVWKAGSCHHQIVWSETYLIFVIFSPRTLFLAKIFSTQKRVNRNKPILRQNSVNRQKNTNFATKQFKMQQNTINCTHIEGDFRFLHICHVKKFEINPHVDEF